MLKDSDFEIGATYLLRTYQEAIFNGSDSDGNLLFTIKESSKKVAVSGVDFNIIKQF